jgi:hypothetical protein
MREDRESVFQHALANRDAAALRRLVESAEGWQFANADPFVLTSTVKIGCLECARVLLDAGIDVNSQEPNGETALYWAATLHAIEFVHLLLKYNANPHIADSRGNDAITQARNWRYDDIAEILERNLITQPIDTPP